MRHTKRERIRQFFIFSFFCIDADLRNHKWWTASGGDFQYECIFVRTSAFKRNRRTIKKTHSNHFRVNKLIFNEAKTIQISAIQFNRSLLSGKQHFCWGWRMKKKKPFDSNYDIRFVFKYFVKLNTYFMVNSIPNWITYRADSIGISGAHHWDALIRYQ